MYYVCQDGSVDVVERVSDVKDNFDMSRLFATVTGASRHADALPMTPIRFKQIREPLYDVEEVINNGWSCDGLTPVDYVTIIMCGDNEEKRHAVYHPTH